MPVYGIGTYSLHGEECKNSIRAALNSGVRMIDTAHAYGNEEEIGEAIREAIRDSGIPREEIFVITKLYPDQFSDPVAAIEEALEKLDIGYIDMMLFITPETAMWRPTRRWSGQSPRERSAPSAFLTGMWKN